DARRLAVLRVDMADVGDVDRGFLLDDHAGGSRGRAGVALDHIHAQDDHAKSLRKQADHFALLALVAPGDDDDLVALLDFQLFGHHRTSGARLMIFMNFLPRSSRVTGPKMRVPIGSPCLLISTAAFVSNLMLDPSVRRISLA